LIPASLDSLWRRGKAPDETRKRERRIRSTDGFRKDSLRQSHATPGGLWDHGIRAYGRIRKASPDFGYRLRRCSWHQGDS